MRARARDDVRGERRRGEIVLVPYGRQPVAAEIQGEDARRPVPMGAVGGCAPGADRVPRPGEGFETVDEDDERRVRASAGLEGGADVRRGHGDRADSVQR